MPKLDIEKSFKTQYEKVLNGYYQILRQFYSASDIMSKKKGLSEKDVEKHVFHCEVLKSIINSWSHIIQNGGVPMILEQIVSVCGEFENMIVNKDERLFTMNLIDLRNMNKQVKNFSLLYKQYCKKNPFDTPLTKEELIDVIVKCREGKYVDEKYMNIWNNSLDQIEKDKDDGMFVATDFFSRLFNAKDLDANSSSYVDGKVPDICNSVYQLDSFFIYNIFSSKTALWNQMIDIFDASIILDLCEKKPALKSFISVSTGAFTSPGVDTKDVMTKLAKELFSSSLMKDVKDIDEILEFSESLQLLMRSLNRMNKKRKTPEYLEAQRKQYLEHYNELLDQFNINTDDDSKLFTDLTDYVKTGTKHPSFSVIKTSKFEPFVTLFTEKCTNTRQSKMEGIVDKFSSVMGCVTEHIENENFTAIEKDDRITEILGKEGMEELMNKTKEKFIEEATAKMKKLLKLQTTLGEQIDKGDDVGDLLSKVSVDIENLQKEIDGIKKSNI